MHKQISDLSHSVLSPMSFRVEFKRPGGTAMFQRNVRFHVDITCATPPADTNGTNGTNGSLDTSSDKPTIYCITFTLISGNKLLSVIKICQSKLFFCHQVLCVDSSASVTTFKHRYWAEEPLHNTRREWEGVQQES